MARPVSALENQLKGGVKDETKYRQLDILFLLNHNIHISLCGLYFLASDPSIEFILQKSMN